MRWLEIVCCSITPSVLSIYELRTRNRALVSSVKIQGSWEQSLLVTVHEQEKGTFFFCLCGDSLQTCWFLNIIHFYLVGYELKSEFWVGFGGFFGGFFGFFWVYLVFWVWLLFLFFGGFLGFFLFGFSVCVVSGVKAEMGSDEDKVFSHSKLFWSNSCSKWVMTQMHFSSCCWVWNSAMDKSIGLRTVAWAHCWCEVGMGFLGSLPKECKCQLLVQLLC